jgi:hypothetical protein
MLRTGKILSNHRNGGVGKVARNGGLSAFLDHRFTPRIRRQCQLDRSLRREINQLQAEIHGGCKDAAAGDGAVGKDVVSRVWRKVKTNWEAWTRRSNPRSTRPA